MKYKNTFYLELSREIFTEKYSELSNNAKWLFVVLNELEHRYTKGNEDCFFRTDTELAKDCGFSIKTLKRAKTELRNTDLIEVWQTHLLNPETGNKSEKHFSAYRILK